MSKTSKATDVETLKDIKVVETAEKSTTATTEPQKKVRKINVTRFLQENPQNFYIEVLLKKNYATKFKTTEEWFETIDIILSTKV